MMQIVQELCKRPGLNRTGNVTCYHRVGRVVVGIGTPPPPRSQASVPPVVPGGGHTRLRERGRLGPNSDEGTYTVVLNIYIYMYFEPVGLAVRSNGIIVYLGPSV